jgi:small-conductance mechanosensitive channel
MNETPTLLSRIGSWFKRSDRADVNDSNGLGNGAARNGELPLGDGGENGQSHLAQTGQLMEPRSTFLRPWARRDAAINQLQEGFVTLTDLMQGIREGLDKQGQRQAELMGFLSTLPQVLQPLPEASKMQGETLKAIHQQLATQNQAQGKLSEILDRMSESGYANKRMLEEIQGQYKTFQQADQKIVDNLSTLGAHMQTVSQHSATTTQVLEGLKSNINQRDDQLERILHKQSTRFTTLLVAAIFFSVAALVAVSVIGYLLILKK